MVADRIDAMGEDAQRGMSCFTDAELLKGANDLWIACQALAEDAALVTNKLREFQRVAGLRLENWAD